MFPRAGKRSVREQLGKKKVGQDQVAILVLWMGRGWKRSYQIGPWMAVGHFQKSSREAVDSGTR